jgi:hypothetical protein
MGVLGEYMRSWRRGPYTLSLYYRGTRWLGYKLSYNRKPIFTGTDYGSSPMHAIDSDASAGALLGFLSAQPGDVDSEYFSKYTQRQLQFAKKHGEELKLWSMELEGDF